MKRLLFAALLASCTPAASMADDMPRYDPDAWCDEVASTGGTSSEWLKGGCMEQEQSAYDELKAQWKGLPAQAREWCDEVARSGGKGSYWLLSGCIQQEADSRQKNSTTKFKF